MVVNRSTSTGDKIFHIYGHDIMVLINLMVTNYKPSGLCQVYIFIFSSNNWKHFNPFKQDNTEQNVFIDKMYKKFDDYKILLKERILQAEILI